MMKKYIKYASAILLSLLILTSCQKNLTAPDGYSVTEAPTSGTLRALAQNLGLKIGAAFSQADMANPERMAIMKSEFDNVTFGYHMKHGAVVQNDGSFNWTTTDAMVASAKQNGLDIYGHTLVWHQNQNATWLKTVVAPPVTEFFGPNLVVNPTFETDLTGWTQLNPNPAGGCGAIHQRVASGGRNGTAGLQVGTCAAITDAGYWRVQIQGNLSANMQAGGNYLVEFWVKSSAATTVQFETRGTEPQYKTFPTTTDWTKVTLNFTANGTEDAIAFDLHSPEKATFQIDDVSVRQVFDGPPNIVANPAFETDLTGWAQLNPNPSGGCGVIHERVANDGRNGTGGLRVGTCAAITDEGYWRVQIRGDLAEKMQAGVDYVVEFYIKSSTATTVQFETRESSGGDAQYATFPTTTDWTKVTLIFKAKGTEDAIAFDLHTAEKATFHIDDVSVKVYIPDNSGDGPSEEDKAKIRNEMKTWIDAIVGRYKADVRSWDVVNEPMADGASGLRTSKNSDASSSDIFFWSDILGRDYGLHAFQYAEGADPEALLFINDYNLESNPAKLDSLIAYVNELNEKGAKIDGIGTQMHISDPKSYGPIREMFEKLAATGLLVKISELDVKSSPSGGTELSPINAEFQAAMYEYVIKTYLEVIPKEQRYGITIWGIDDASSWLNTSERKYFPLLWDNSFQRKPAYHAIYQMLNGQ
ncbi:endo-1,4-beta-xylanase [Sphingobacterium sp. DN00404]|uniref:Beta-xylanase n=1 Tax=Sphingobacterium micropteri TaxID=2763501 RepID=A0ABR7YNT4_9SPHI|nr:endo-1,4-beta-xylanase [Sphingobacterium micropteri]MBD1432970.1 endo-1,4-beta-xylanase [Sphingobacterium micropteri]